MLYAIFPGSLHALCFAGSGTVSLPDLKHLTALTELRLDMAVLTPTCEQLPCLPALPVLSLIGAYYWPWDRPDGRGWWPGPLPDLGLACSTPLLAEVRFAVGFTHPHVQLATLAPLAQLRIALDFFDNHKELPAEHLLRPDTLLSLPPSVTQLILCGFERCVPAVALPEKTAIVYEESLLARRSLIHAFGP